jgi:hypothetical protein
MGENLVQGVPTVAKESVPLTTEISNYFKGITDYLRRLTSSIYGGVSQVTMGAANYARDVKSAVDPVVSAVGESAKQASEVSFLGSLLDPNDKSGIRTFYDRSTSIANRAEQYKSVTSPEIEARLKANVLTPEQIRDLTRSVPLPPRKVNEPAKKKKKAKRYGDSRPIYKGKVRISRRRK